MPVHQKDPDAFSAQEYDFIILGGGTAGLALAARLTEDTNVLVGVLEAGKSHLDDPRILTPGLCASAVGDPEYDWMFMTTIQVGKIIYWADHSGTINYSTDTDDGAKENLNSRKVAWPRGRGLGGLTAINFMQVTYPTKSEVDAWGNWETRDDLGKISHHSIENFI